jgi:hypothetical protein
VTTVSEGNALTAGQGVKRALRLNAMMCGFGMEQTFQISPYQHLHLPRQTKPQNQSVIHSLEIETKLAL